MKSQRRNTVSDSRRQSAKIEGALRRTTAALSKLGLFLALVLALGVAPAGAQETGRVTGEVVDAGTGEPLQGAQVLVEGTQLGTLTGADGRYSIRGVPAGQRTVAVQLIGYGRSSQAVTVEAGQSATADFELREEALELDQIVVTGTAGEEQRRAIGNVVSTLDADAVSEEAPVSDMQDLLGQRTPGMMQLPTAGQVGTGSPIRLRGISSMSPGNGPIVYVDGVRVDSDPRRGPNTRGGSRINRLNDFSPQDIESVEIIKGPSAATLYGTEASNGVIQIITKKGASGDPVISLRAEAGTNWMQNPEGRTPPRYRLNSETGEVEGPFNIYERELELGNPPIFQHGTLGSGSVNVRGGTDTFGYFTSGSYRKETGVVGYDFHERLNARGNVDVDITTKLNLTKNTAYIKNTTRLAQNSGGFGGEPFSNLIWNFPSTYDTPQRGFLSAPPEEWGKVETVSNTDRSTTGVQMRYQPYDWFSHRLSLGLTVTTRGN
jgi:TonB-dependent SusC/RagA subfamily outer membrane receptor